MKKKSADNIFALSNPKAETVKATAGGRINRHYKIFVLSVSLLIILLVPCLFWVVSAQSSDVQKKPFAQKNAAGNRNKQKREQKTPRRKLISPNEKISEKLKTNPSLNEGTVDGTFADNLFTAPYKRSINFVLQTDNKAIIFGDFNTLQGNTRTALARVNTDGTIDSSYNPRVVYDDKGIEYSVHIQIAVIQPDGKLIITGDFNKINDVFQSNIARLNTDGSLDTSFNIDLPYYPYLNNITVQPDGKILVSAYFEKNPEVSLVRFNNDGTVDTTFNAETGASYTYGIIVQPDGKLLLSGGFNIVSDMPQRFIIRLNQDGSSDSSFDVVFSSSEYAYAYLSALQPDGKIIVGGSFEQVNGITRNNFARLNSDGTLDEAFEIDSLYNIGPVALQSDSKILLGIYSEDDRKRGGNHPAGIIRINSDGTVDKTFIADSILDSVDYIGIQSDGKILASASARSNGEERNGLVRLYDSGSLDLDYHIRAGSYEANIFETELQSDGKLLVLGDFEYVNNIYRQGIARFNNDGTLDESFNASINHQFRFDLASEIMRIQSDGKILVVGDFSVVNGMQRRHIVRLNSDGSVDDSFNQPQFTGLNDYVTVQSIALDSGGKILIGGEFNSVNNISRTGFAKLNSDGTLDETFNVNLLNGLGKNPYLTKIFVQSDGKILIGGFFTSVNGQPKKSLARLNSSGLPDDSFNPKPYVYSDISDIDVQSDGKILVCGKFGEDSDEPDKEYYNGIIRLLTDGTVDDSFSSSTYTNERVFAEIQTDGKILLVKNTHTGELQAMSRLKPNGLYDYSFYISFSDLASIEDIEIQPDGKIFLAGQFNTLINTVPPSFGTRTEVLRNSLVRLDNKSLALTLNPATVYGGQTAIGSIAINRIAPPEGIIIEVSSNETDIATVPKTVVIPAGSNKADFMINTVNPMIYDRFVDISATYSKTTEISTLEVRVPYPDLTAELTVPAETVTDTPFNISWVVRNQGESSLSGTWTDIVEFSTDGTNYNRLLGQFPITQTLDPGQEITRTQTVTIPYASVSQNGTYFIRVRTDSNNNINEGPYENNNTSVKTSSVRMAPRPDLAAELTLPAEIRTDEPFNVTWVVRNQGDAPVSGTWTDRVEFSTNGTNYNTVLGQFPITQTLEPGQEVTRTQSVTVPFASVSQNGTYYIRVRVDFNNNVNEGIHENNNSTVKTLFVRRIPRPDLIVENISAPNTAFFGQTIRIQWTVKNNSAGATNASDWYDWYYISSDNIPQIEDPVRARLQNVSYLAAGESYTASADVLIPRGLVGNYKIIIWTDGDGSNHLGEHNHYNVFESNESNNYALTRQITLSAPPLPDLQTTLVQSPAEGFAGQAISLNWRVENRGNGNMLTDQNTWTDEIYLSQDTTFNPNTDRLIGSRIRQGRLLQNEGYNVSNFNVNLPGNITGNWYVFVLTDARNIIYEFNDENNNSNYDRQQPGSPLIVRSTPPDLIVETINTPSSGQAGRLININWSVKNQGAFPAQGGWADTVYLSSDSTPSPATDTLLMTNFRSSNLEPGAAYNVSKTVKLPDCASGNQFLYVYTDSRNILFEFDPTLDAEANNYSQVRPITINNLPSDLQVTVIDNPAAGIAGQPINVSWTVGNQGADSTVDGIWIDRIYLSQTATLNTATAIPIGAAQHTGALDNGESYTLSQNVIIPNTAQGNYFLIVDTDSTDRINECGNENNNQTTGATQINISNNLPDLTVSDFSFVNDFVAGQTVNLQWTVNNSGTVDAQNRTWSDAVYFSTNNVLDAEDVPLGLHTVNGPLASGGSYTKQGQVITPIVAPGNYFLILKTDSEDGVFEGTGNSNNTRILEIPFETPMIDLQVTNVDVPANAYSGLSMTVNWTVTNVGANQTIGSQWTDAIIISLDQILDSTDRIIGYKQHHGALNGSTSYNESAQVSVPSGLTGHYYIFVRTDRNNQVAESNEDNNISFDGLPLELPPPADLIVSNIIAPANGSPGESMTFNWTVQNVGGNPALGLWNDAVYLSTDSVWDIDDILIGHQSTLGPIAPGQSYNASLSATLPGINLGQYQVIVRADVRNRVRETNENNNSAASLNSVAVDATELPLGVPVNTTLVTGQERYYKTNVDGNETLKFSLTGQADSYNELFTRFGQMANRSGYDFQFDRLYEPDQEIVVPNTQAGNYYTLARSDYVPPATNNAVVVKAEVLQFGLRQVTPSETGNQGYTTIVFSGAKFTEQTKVKLVNDEGVTLLPHMVKVFPHKIYGIFDFKAVQPGNYRAVAESISGEISIVDNAVQVKAGGGANVDVQISHPKNIVVNKSGHFNIVLKNTGTNDALLSILLLQMPKGSRVEMRRSLIESISEVLPPPDGLNSWDEIPLTFDKGEFAYLPISVPLIRVNESESINIKITPPSGLDSLPLRAMLMPGVKSIDNSTNRLGNRLSSITINRTADAGCNPEEDCAKELRERAMQKMIDILQERLIDLIPGDCLREVIDRYTNINRTVIGTAIANKESGEKPSAWSLTEEIAIPPSSLFRTCAEDVVKRFPVVFGALTLYEIIRDTLDAAEDLDNLYNKCILLNGSQSSSSNGDCQKGGADITTSSIVRPIDPNDKIGPAGFGEQGFIAKSSEIPYVINFENVSTATAYAQQVRITDQLDPNLDWRTFRIKEIGFGSHRIKVPANRAFFQERIQLGAEFNNLLADVNAGVDIANGTVVWTMTAIDPLTGEQPNDADLGLLAPNDASGRGQGFVSYTIQPKQTAVTGSIITNKATIVFDTEEPIVTNTVSNTLDADLPESQVAALPSTSEPTFTVSWSGSDVANGSGLQSFDVLVSENGGIYQPLVSGTTETSAQFTGVRGKTYRFYSIARDNAGNTEGTPSQPDTATTIIGGAFEADVAPRPNGNNNGSVTVADLTQIGRFVAGLDTPDQPTSTNEFQRTDTAPRSSSGNGFLTVADITQAGRYVAGIDPLQTADGAIAPSLNNRLSTENNPKQDNAIGLAREIRPVRIGRTENRFVVAVELETATGNALANAVGFTLNFDPTVLRNPSNIRLGTGAGSATLIANTDRTAEGRLGIVLYKAANQTFPAGVQELVVIEFEVINITLSTTTFSFSDQPVVRDVSDVNANSLPTSFTPRSLALLAPTAARVEIGGRVVNAAGSAIKGARITLTDSAGRIRTATTNSFGIYRLEDIDVGSTVVIRVAAKGYVFSNNSQVLTIMEEEYGINFIANE